MSLNILLRIISNTEPNLAKRICVFLSPDGGGWSTETLGPYKVFPSFSILQDFNEYYIYVYIYE